MFHIRQQQNLLSSRSNHGHIAFKTAADDAKMAKNKAAVVPERRTVCRRPDVIGGHALINQRLLALPLGDNGHLYGYGVMFGGGGVDYYGRRDVSRDDLQKNMQLIT